MQFFVLSTFNFLFYQFLYYRLLLDVLTLGCPCIEITRNWQKFGILVFRKQLKDTIRRNVEIKYAYKITTYCIDF